MTSHYIFPDLVQNASVQGAAYSNAPTLTDYLREVHGNNVQLAASPFDALKSKMPPPPPPKFNGLTVDVMRPKLDWIDPNFVPQQPQGNLLAPWWPTASNVSDWLTGPPGTPQATDDPAYKRRLEGTLPLPGVRPATQDEQFNALMSNAPWLSK